MWALDALAFKTYSPEPASSSDTAVNTSFIEADLPTLWTRPDQATNIVNIFHTRALFKGIN